MGDQYFWSPLGLSLFLQNQIKLHLYGSGCIRSWSPHNILPSQLSSIRVQAMHEQQYALSSRYEVEVWRADDML